VTSRCSAVQGRGAAGGQQRLGAGRAPVPAGELQAQAELGGGLGLGGPGRAPLVHRLVPAADDGFQVSWLIPGLVLLPRPGRILAVPWRARDVLPGAGDAGLVAGDGVAGVLGQVVPDVPPVGDLDRGWGGGPGGPVVGAGPVPADDLHLRMRAQPGLHRGCLPVRQHVHRDAGLHVDQQRGVGAAAAEREVVQLLRYRSKWIYPDLGIIPTAGAAMWWMPWWRAGS